MSLDVPVPDAPSLHGPQSRDDYEAIGNPVADPEDDYRREELEGILSDGAWADAFDEWAPGTDLSEAEFEVVTRLGLVDAFDFYWDAATDEVGFQAPTLPDDVRADMPTSEADDIDGELDELGRIVSETLENDYLLRDDERFGFFADDAPDDEYEYRDA